MAQLYLNQTLRSVNRNTYTVKKLLGSGCQGEVYFGVDKRKRPVALKLYFHDKLKQIQGGYDRQYQIILRLTSEKSPDERLAWPQDIIHFRETFGYVMDMVPSGYISIKRFLSDPKYYLSGNFTSRVRVCYQLTEVFQKLHMRGYCYGDVSDGNILLNPANGDIMVIDNDNVVVNGQDANILGTQEYIAPELLRSKAIPNRQSDLYSLSVLLFKILYLGHPLLGKREPPVMNKESETELFIKHPVFIFDPENETNRPDKKQHANVLIYWKLYPKFLNDLFIRAFAVGLKDVNARVNETEWLIALQRLENSFVCCSAQTEHKLCRAGNFFDRDKADNLCWQCGNPLGGLRMVVKNNVVNELALNGSPPTRFSSHTIYNDGDRDTMIAEVAVISRRRGELGLKNLTKKPWLYLDENGKEQTIKKNGVAPLFLGRTIVFDAERNVIGKILK